LANIINGTDTGSGGLITTGDSSDELQLQTAEVARVTLTNTAVVVNESGANVDFRVEGDTDANLLFVDASAESIGVGTSSPSSYGTKLAVSGAANVYGDERKVVSIIDTTALAAGVGAGVSFFGVSESGGGVSQFGSIKGIKENATSANYAGALAFVTSNIANVQTERMRLTSDGYLRMASGSGGIQFNGDTLAANALDDYEEGTWTPTAFGETTAGTTTYSFQLGQYVKVGNMVTCTAGIGVSNMTGTGKVLFGNLPFTQSNTTMDAYSASIGKVSLLTFSNQLGLMGIGNSTYIRVISISSGNGYSQVDVDTVFEFYYTITFFV
jgi:hypothetical protein